MGDAYGWLVRISVGVGVDLAWTLGHSGLRITGLRPDIFGGRDLCRDGVNPSARRFVTVSEVSYFCTCGLESFVLRGPDL